MAFRRIFGSGRISCYFCVASLLVLKWCTRRRRWFFIGWGNDLGKLTATGADQKRHARDWARFLVKANKEVSSAETTGAWGCAGKPAKGSPKGESRGSDQGNRGTSAGRGVRAEARRFFNHGWHNRAPGQARDGATEGWPEGRGSGNERVKLTRIPEKPAGRRTGNLCWRFRTRLPAKQACRLACF